MNDDQKLFYMTIKEVRRKLERKKNTAEKWVVFTIMENNISKK